MTDQQTKTAAHSMLRPKATSSLQSRILKHDKNLTADLSPSFDPIYHLRVNKTHTISISPQELNHRPEKKKQEILYALSETHISKKVESLENNSTEINRAVNTPIIAKSLKIFERSPKKYPSFARQQYESAQKLVKNVNDLLRKIQPSDFQDEDEFQRKMPDLSLQPRRPSLLPQIQSTRGTVSKPKVSFKDEFEVIEVENWKLFNVDMAKKLNIEVSRNRKNFCTLF